MPRFICAVHAPDGEPRAFALVEQMPGDADGPDYTVRDLRTLDATDPTADLLDVTASEEQYAGNVRFVTTGGQRSADALHARGPSAMAVQIRRGGSASADAQSVSLQVLVDTFERLYRADAVDVPGQFDAASSAVDALYAAADLENAAPGSNREDDGDLKPGAPGTSDAAPDASIIEQSGSAASLSTEAIKAPIRPDEASAAAVAAQTHVARTAAETSADIPDLGEHADVATALALAVWFGESSRDRIGDTDQADEASAARMAQK